MKHLHPNIAQTTLISSGFNETQEGHGILVATIGNISKGKKMQIEDRKEGEVLIVKLLAERLDASVAADFNKRMTEFIDSGNELIVLDMSEVDFIDSSGLGAVISTLKKLRDKGELAVCGMRGPISSLFHMIRLDRVVKIFSRQEEAISELSRGDDGTSIGYKRIKLVIDSDLEDVSLIGTAINRLCSSIPLSDTDSYQIELCVVEAVNNSIEHAYRNEKGHEVDVVFTLHPDKLIVDIWDSGKPMDQECMEQKDVPLLEIDPNGLDNIPEQGRGLPIMKEIMDAIIYKTENGKNCLTLIKNM